MRLTQHIAVSSIVSLGLYAWTQSFPIAISSFLAGFLLDLDHLIDYWREHPIKFDLIHFFKTCEEFRLVKVYLFLHSIELLLPLGFLAYYSRSPWVLGFLIGFSQHMLFDHLLNPVFPYTYSFFYRWNKGFANEKVFDIKKQSNG
ncbi:MAG: hypothetical protein NT145_04685 [Elusimicrobia bacterium]|nr:hypothetical protein [Elusimicrobiota bacterium]